MATQDEKQKEAALKALEESQKREEHKELEEKNQCVTLRFMEAASGRPVLTELDELKKLPLFVDFRTKEKIAFKASHAKEPIFQLNVEPHRLIGLDLTGSPYQAVWRNLVFRPGDGCPDNPTGCLDLCIPVEKTACPREMTQMNVYVSDCSPGPEGHEHEHEHGKPFDNVTVRVRRIDTPQCGTPYAQDNPSAPVLKRTHHGVARFYVASGEWYSVTVDASAAHARVSRPCGEIHMYASPGSPADVRICCTPIKTKLEVRFQDGCAKGVRVPFMLDGQEYLPDSEGKQIIDIRPGTHVIAPAGPLPFPAREVHVEASATALFETFLIRETLDQEILQSEHLVEVGGSVADAAKARFEVWDQSGLRVVATANPDPKTGLASIPVPAAGTYLVKYFVGSAELDAAEVVATPSSIAIS